MPTAINPPPESSKVKNYVFEFRESWPSRDLCLLGHKPNLIPVALRYLTLPSEDISHRNAHIQFRSLHKYLWSSVPRQACTEQIRGSRQPGPGALAEFLLHRREDRRAQAGREVSACRRRTQRDQEALEGFLEEPRPVRWEGYSLGELSSVRIQGMHSTLTVSPDTVPRLQGETCQLT